MKQILNCWIASFHRSPLIVCSSALIDTWAKEKRSRFGDSFHLSILSVIVAGVFADFLMFHYRQAETLAGKIKGLDNKNSSTSHTITLTSYATFWKRTTSDIPRAEGLATDSNVKTSVI